MDMEMELTSGAAAPAVEHAAPAKTPAPAAAHGQQHPIKLYLVVWTALFILSACSYLVDYFDFHGYLRWSLIVLFMMMKASLIVAIFMHMAWERLALVIAILLPPLAVLVLMAMMAVEADYTNLSRLIFFAAAP
jgi:cytochrome c oxidase subunit IV